MSGIAKLDTLAKEANKKAYLSLIGLIFVFMFSVFMFLFAESILKSVQQSDASIYETGLNKRLSHISEEIEKHRIFLKSNESRMTSSEDEAIELSIKIKNTEKNIQELESEIPSINEELKILRKNRLENLSSSNENSISNIVSVTITRLGAVMLAVFMMQILLSFFRYFLRLSNYYEAKATALRGVSSSESGEIYRSISPEQIAFGKEPQLSFDKLIEVIKLSK